MPKTAEYLSDYPAFRLTLGGIGDAPGDVIEELTTCLKDNGLTVQDLDSRTGYIGTYYCDCRQCNWSEVTEAEARLREIVGDVLVIEWDFLTGDHWEG